MPATQIRANTVRAPVPERRTEATGRPLKPERPANRPIRPPENASALPLDLHRSPNLGELVAATPRARSCVSKPAKVHAGTAGRASSLDLTARRNRRQPSWASTEAPPLGSPTRSTSTRRMSPDLGESIEKGMRALPARGGPRSSGITRQVKRPPGAPASPRKRRFARERRVIRVQA
jgi:hypothetical protein